MYVRMPVCSFQLYGKGFADLTPATMPQPLQDSCTGLLWNADYIFLINLLDDSVIDRNIKPNTTWLKPIIFLYIVSQPISAQLNPTQCE